VAASAPTSAVGESADGAGSYSQTNIQVAGVDEPDVLKNDGEFIYKASGKKVSIMKAYPAEELSVVSEIELWSPVSGIFLNDNKLVAFVQEYNYYDTKIPCGVISEIGIPCGGYSRPKTFVIVYDISDKENPKIETNYSVDGYYSDARMIGDYVYMVSRRQSI
jgi:uncharacterized secreted protein with C-terminal beta-propeller domain